MRNKVNKIEFGGIDTRQLREQTVNKMSKAFSFTLIFLLSALFLYRAMGVLGPNSPTASTAAIGVDPLTSRAEVGRTFMINIEISDVIDLYGWEFKLRWNSTLLEALSITEGVFLKGGGNTFFVSKINNTVGYMLVDCSLVGDVPGVSGNGILATAEFCVETRGECVLDLYNTKLVSSLEQPITHTTIDGYYCTPIPIIHDLNNDGVVNILDVAIIAAAFRSKPGDLNWNAIADLNDDEEVDILDVGIIAGEWGKTT